MPRASSTLRSVSQSQPESDLLRLLVGTFGVVALLALAVFSISSGAAVRTALKWPTVLGRIDYADVRAYGGPRLTSYAHELHFSYQVGEVVYHGSFSPPGPWFVSPPSWPSSNEAIQRVPHVGSSIAVRYNPKTPDNFMLYLSPVAGMDFIVAAFFSVLATLCGVCAFPSVRRMIGGEK